MPNELTTEIIEFICGSLDNIERKRATCITGNFQKKLITGSYTERKIEIYIEIKEDKQH